MEGGRERGGGEKVKVRWMDGWRGEGGGGGRER